MGKGREERKQDLPEGELFHNPFAALRPEGTPAPKEAVEAEARSGEPAPGGKLVVRHESKGRGGKTVTRVTGLAPGAPLDDLAREVRKALGAGAKVEGEDLLIQGKQVERAAAWLESRGLGPVLRGN